MRQFRYVTNRAAKNNAGEGKGKIKACVREGSETAEIDYLCPECAFSEHKEQPFVRPLIVKCSKCGFIIKLPKLKDEIKKDKKASKAA
jgi:ribosomal protein L37AE/L43A